MSSYGHDGDASPEASVKPYASKRRRWIYRLGPVLLALWLAVDLLNGWPCSLPAAHAATTLYAPSYLK